MRVIRTAYGQPNEIECDCNFGWCHSEACVEGLCSKICIGEEEGKPECRNCGAIYPQFFRRLEDIPVYFANSIYAPRKKD